MRYGGAHDAQRCAGYTGEKSPMPVTTREKVRENRLRRTAERQGLKLLKSRRRDPHAIDFGTYMLVDPNRCALVPADHNRGCGLDLDGVETWLTESAEQ